MKRLARAILVIAALAVGLAGAVSWLLHSDAAGRWALERAQSASGGAMRIEGARGTPAREQFIDRLTYAGPGFRVEARGLALRGARLALTGAVSVETLRADSVDVSLAGGGAGQPKRDAPARIGLPLAVRVDRAEVDELRVRTGPSDFSFRRLAFRYEGGPSRHRVDALTVATPWGDAALHAEVAGAAPFALSAAAALARADPRYPLGAGVELAGDLDRVVATARGGAAGAVLEARALLAPLAPRPLVSITAKAASVDLARLAPGAPETALTLEVRGERSTDAALAGEITATNARAGTIDSGRLPLSRVDGRFSTDFRSVRLGALTARFDGGGTLSGSGDADAGGARFELRATALDLRSLHSALRRTRLEGPLQIAVSAQRLALRGALSQEGMRLAADAVKTGDTVEVRSFSASANGGELKGRARLALAASIGVTGELALSRFDPSQFGDYPQGSINGSARIEGRLGATRRMDARWSVADSRLAGLALAGRGEARIAGERVSGLSADIRLGQTRVSARGAFGGRGDELAWSLDAPRLAELGAQLAGRVHAEGRASGGWRDPRVAFLVRGEALRLPGGVAAQSVSAKGALGKDRGAPLELELLARDVDARGVAIARLEARSSGTVAAHAASVSAETPGANEFRLVARVRGGWSARDGWAGELLELRNEGRYPARLSSPVRVRVSGTRVEVGPLEAALGQGRILVRESVWTPGRFSSSGEFAGLPAAWLLAPAGLAGKLESTLLLDGGWLLRSDPGLSGTLSVRRAGGDIAVPGTPRIELGLERVGLDARFREGALSADAAVESRLARLAFRGEMKPEAGADGLGAASPISFRARIDVSDIGALAKPFLTQARLGGRLGAELRGSGTLGNPAVTGTASGETIRIDVPPYGVYLKDGKLAASLEGDRVRITELSIRGGTGAFSASGTLPLRLADGGRLDWRARDLGLLDRPDMRLVVSGEGAVRLEQGRVALSGELRAGSGFLDIDQDRLPDLGSDVVVLGERAPPPKRALRSLPVALDLQVDLGERLTVQGLGFDGKVAGRGRLSTDKAGELRAEGRITAKDATYLAYGQRLDVDPGVLVFDGPIDNPALQITAWRRNQAVEAGVQISGTARSPRAQLVSQPAVPDGEKLSWLVLGRPPDDATKADLALLQAAAGALLPRGSSVPLTRRIARSVGLDDITLRGNSELAERVVAFGKRLSDRLYVSYEQAVGATAANLVKLDYTLSRRWSLRAETGTITGLGLFYRYSWD